MLGAMSMSDVMSIIHYRALYSTHPVRPSPALSGLRRALLAWRTSSGPVVLLLLIRLPLRIFLLILRMDGVRKATSVGIHRASCVQRVCSEQQNRAQPKLQWCAPRCSSTKSASSASLACSVIKQPCWFSKGPSTLGAAGDCSAVAWRTSSNSRC